jgi:hypothetical protein
MPNYCFNELTFKPGFNELTFMELLEKLNSAKVYDSDGDYASQPFFQVIHPNEDWGTKWDIVDFDDDLDWVEEYREKGEININFITAWSPPVELYEYMTETLGISVDAHFLETGNDIYGSFKDGEIIEYGDVESQAQFLIDKLDYHPHDEAVLMLLHGDDYEDIQDALGTCAEMAMKAAVVAEAAAERAMVAWVVSAKCY